MVPAWQGALSAIADFVFQHPRSAALRWLPALYAASPSSLATFRACCFDEAANFAAHASRLGAAEGSQEWAQLLALRGSLHDGVLQHCLELQHRKDFGINRSCASCTAWTAW